MRACVHTVMAHVDVVTCHVWRYTQHSVRRLSIFFKCVFTNVVFIYIYIYIFIISYGDGYNLLLNIVDVCLMDTVKMSTKRNAKARLPYSPGQAAKTALAKTAARRSANRVTVVQRDVTVVKPVTPGATPVVENPKGGSEGAGKVDQTLSTALRAELLELLRSTQSQVAARSSTTTSAHEGFATFELPQEPTVEDFEGNLKQVMANLPLEAGLNSKSPFV